MTMGKEGAERCYAVMFKHSKAHETHQTVVVLRVTLFRVGPS
eukprot:COSAG02_NODE_36281_length_456_cov_2.008403_1_plen_41_part_10